MSDSPKDGVVNHRGEVFDTIFGGFGEDNLKKQRVTKVFLFVMARSYRRH